MVSSFCRFRSVCRSKVGFSLYKNINIDKTFIVTYTVPVCGDSEIGRQVSQDKGFVNEKDLY